VYWKAFELTESCVTQKIPKTQKISAVFFGNFWFLLELLAVSELAAANCHGNLPSTPNKTTASYPSLSSTVLGYIRFK
jgi:hypothetical protein